MRRDICCMYNKNIREVFNAYMSAIDTVLGKRGEAQPYHTISFGLNMSFRYNINGGSCTVHLMPYSGGTAVDVRYSIAQLAGARYAAHCQELTRGVEEVLGVPSMPVDLDVEIFLMPYNQVTSANDPRIASAPAFAPAPAPVLAPPPPPAPMAPTAPMPELAPQPAYVPAPQPFKFCTSCGTKLSTDARFCTACGKPQ